MLLPKTNLINQMTQSLTVLPFLLPVTNATVNGKIYGVSLPPLLYYCRREFLLWNISISVRQQLDPSKTPSPEILAFFCTTLLTVHAA